MAGAKNLSETLEREKKLKAELAEIEKQKLKDAEAVKKLQQKEKERLEREKREKETNDFKKEVRGLLGKKLKELGFEEREDKNWSGTRSIFYNKIVREYGKFRPATGYVYNIRVSFDTTMSGTSFWSHCNKDDIRVKVGYSDGTGRLKYEDTKDLPGAKGAGIALRAKNGSVSDKLAERLEDGESYLRQRYDRIAELEKAEDQVSAECGKIAKECNVSYEGSDDVWDYGYKLKKTYYRFRVSPKGLMVRVRATMEDNKKIVFYVDSIVKVAEYGHHEKAALKREQIVTLLKLAKEL